MIYEGNLNAVGNTPLIKITDEKLDNINFYIKFEGYNPTGSVKDRAAQYVLNKVLRTGEINKDTTIIESSSGNFGIALSSYCKDLNLKCKIVIDPNILPVNEFIIRSHATDVIKVTEHDETGGFLLTRTRLIDKILKTNDNYYWTNQYANPYIAEAYHNTLGEEICREVNVDYAFLGVSSGGTISGVSRRIKESYPNAKIIAVDIVGSVIFGNNPQKRYIPGIGSSMRPKILETAKIDDVVMIEEVETIKMCYEILEKQFMLAGGSSGSVYKAIRKYFAGKKFSRKPNVVAVFANRGDRYVNTIYNPEWVKAHYQANKEYVKMGSM